MSTSSSRGQAARPVQGGLSRRELLVGAAWVLGAAVLPVRPARATDVFELDERTRHALTSSLFVYVSPLHPDGNESRCHAEVWFFEDGGDVVLATGARRWKVRALERGWTSARVWVGDYGRVKRDGEAFRKAPTFLAGAALDRDPAVFERLQAAFAKRYPEEWGKWAPRFRAGYDEGTRVLIRYRPIGA